MIDGVAASHVIMAVIIHALIVTILDILFNINGKTVSQYVYTFLFVIISINFGIFVKIDKNSWGFVRTSGVNDYLTIQEIISTIIITVR